MLLRAERWTGAELICPSSFLSVIFFQEREKHRFVVPLFYTLTLAHRADALTN